MQNLKLFIKALRYKIGSIRNSQGIETNWHKSLLLYPFKMFTHPIETFNDLKYEKKASLWIANIMAFLFCFVRMAGHTSTAYLFKSADSEQTSAITVGIISILTIVVWTMCNWATCTLFDGEGSIKDIWVVTTYSLFPYIIFSSLNIVLSYMFTTSEMTFIPSFLFWELLGHYYLYF